VDNLSEKYATFATGLFKIHKSKKKNHSSSSNLKFNQLKTFDPDTIGKYLSYEEDGKKITTIIGTFDKNQKFSPEITQKILDLQGVLNFINAAHQVQPDTDATVAEKPLHDILALSLYLEKCFLFLDKKSKLIKKNSEAEAFKKKLVKPLKTMRWALLLDITAIKKSSIESDFIERWLKALTIRDFSWITYNTSEKDKTVNGYLLPQDYANHYLLQRVSPNNTDTLLNLARNLTRGEISTIVASLKEPNSQIGTSRASTNYLFLKKLAELGVADEIKLEADIPDDVKANLTSFTIKEQKISEIVDLLKKAHPEIADKI